MLKGPAERQCVYDPITQAVRIGSEGREQGHHVEAISGLLNADIS